jgi:hypothetical protein
VTAPYCNIAHLKSGTILNPPSLFTEDTLLLLAIMVNKKIQRYNRLVEKGYESMDRFYKSLLASCRRSHNRSRGKKLAKKKNLTCLAGLDGSSEPGSRTPRNREAQRMRGGYVTDTPVRMGLLKGFYILTIYAQSYCLFEVTVQPLPSSHSHAHFYSISTSSLVEYKANRSYNFISAYLLSLSQVVVKLMIRFRRLKSE